jgi:hypothetical protein
MAAASTIFSIPGCEQPTTSTRPSGVVRAIERLRQPLIAAFRPAIFDPDVATLDEALVLQATAKAGDEVREGSGGGAAEEAYQRHRRLLGPRGERPGDSRAAEKANELTSPHIRS